MIRSHNAVTTVDDDALQWLLQNSPDVVLESAISWLPVHDDASEQDQEVSVASTRTTLHTMAQLNTLRARERLPAFMWWQVAANQKNLYRERMLNRVGHAPAFSAATAFEFNNADWQNIFQLEALVEFYMNFNDPWMSGPPLTQGINLPRPPWHPPMLDNGYISVNLLTGWHLVLVDSFGGRLNGAAATAAGDVVTLDGLPNPSKVNPNFDTIYLPNDTTRASKTYRITTVHDAQHTVTLDGRPSLTGGSSRWHVPAGVSGQLPPLAYNLGPGGALGFDHFDGAMFIVKDGVVHRRFRWNSYTSRNYPDPRDFQNLSSQRGNKRYDFSSFRSGRNGAFRNYNFKVKDAGAVYDGVREARFYFSTPVTGDIAPIGVNPERDPQERGKSLIRIHHSVTNAAGGCSSAGCLVSGDFYAFRDQMIDLYQTDYAAAHGGRRDAAVDRLRGAGHAASQTIWRRTQGEDHSAGSTVTAAEWNDRMQGTLWLVRPDERPL